MFIDSLSAHQRLQYLKFFSEAVDLVRRVLLIPNEDLRKEIRERIFYQSSPTEGYYVFTIDRVAVSDIRLVEEALMRIMSKQIPKKEQKKFLSQPILSAISEIKERLEAKQ
jgi:hypothetical protein